MFFACEQEVAEFKPYVYNPSSPTGESGSADFTKFVSIGGAYVAGFGDGGLGLGGGALGDAGLGDAGLGDRRLELDVVQDVVKRRRDAGGGGAVGVGVITRSGRAGVRVKHDRSTGVSAKFEVVS